MEHLLAILACAHHHHSVELLEASGECRLQLLQHNQEVEKRNRNLERRSEECSALSSELEQCSYGVESHIKGLESWIRKSESCSSADMCVQNLLRVMLKPNPG